MRFDISEKRITSTFRDIPPSQMLHVCFCSADILPWRRRSCVPPKRRFTYGAHGAISQKVVAFISTAVRTSDPTYLSWFPLLNRFFSDKWDVLLRNVELRYGTTLLVAVEYSATHTSVRNLKSCRLTLDLLSKKHWLSREKNNKLVGSYLWVFHDCHSACFRSFTILCCLRKFIHETYTKIYGANSVLIHVQ
jgi:hypothetical protein